MTTEIILETQNIRKQFGGLVAVDNVSIKVRKNSLHAIIGPNGAGKTTFFNLLSGNLEPTSGKVIYKGQDITHQPVHRTIHFGIGRSFQITNIFPNLTVFENIRLASQALGSDNFKFWQASSRFKKYEERTWNVIERVGLKERAQTSEQVPELIALIQGIQKEGNKTVMLVEHNMNVVMSVSDAITVMHQGMVLAEGTPAEIAANKEVQTAYLGGLYELNV